MQLVDHLKLNNACTNTHLIQRFALYLQDYNGIHRLIYTFNILHYPLYCFPFFPYFIAEKLKAPLRLSVGSHPNDLFLVLCDAVV